MMRHYTDVLGINCGPGFDRVLADQNDIVSNNCEQVSRKLEPGEDARGTALFRGADDNGNDGPEPGDDNGNDGPEIGDDNGAT